MRLKKVITKDETASGYGTKMKLCLLYGTQKALNVQQIVRSLDLLIEIAHTLYKDNNQWVEASIVGRSFALE